MLGKILPFELEKLFSLYVNIEKLNEIRIRLNKPIILNICNKIYSLNDNGLCVLDEGIVATKEMIEKIIYLASENSFYSVGDQISSGFITAEQGIRIGLCGQVVYENNKVINIRDISYLNIRIPHEIEGCSKAILPYIFENEKVLHNTLIISAPGIGKTTLLRDIIKNLSKGNSYFNSLVIDERYEIAGINSHNYSFDLGYSTDILYGCKKDYGFSVGIRTMSPNIIFTDELATKEDVEGVLYAYNCGVKIIATSHALNLQEFLNKSELKDVINNRVFTRYIVLSKRNGIGTIEGLYNQDFKLLYRE